MRRCGPKGESGSVCLASRCGSVNQKKFSAEMEIHFPELKNIRKPVVWVFPELLSAWIAAPRNFLFLKLNCANSQRKMPLPEVNLELSLTTHRE
jgi:hypothetical protein